MLWSVIYLNRVCVKVYQIWVPSKYDRDRALETSEGQFIGNDGVWIWLVGDNINVNQNIWNIGTWHQLEPPWTNDLSTFWNEKILSVHWKFNGMYCKELFDTGWPMESSRSAKLIAGGVNCSGQITSLRQFDKVSDEIKPYNVQNLT